MIKGKILILNMICLLLISAICIPSINSEEANTKGTIYVDDDADPSWYDATHVQTIQEGINNATNGDTIIVFNGTYNENVEVYKQLTLQSAYGPESCIVTTGTHPVFNITVNSYVNITGFTINGTTYDGIWCSYYQIFQEHINISNNIIINCRYAVLGMYINHSTIYNNTLIENDYGIAIYQSINGSIKGNIIQSNFYGMVINFFHDYTIENNTISDHFYGISSSYYSNTLIVGNNISSNNQGLNFANCYNITITDNNITDHLYNGIFADNVTNSIIANNVISNNSLYDPGPWPPTHYGLKMEDCYNNLIYNNYFENYPTLNVHDNGNNIWNISKTPGTNIMGGPFLGGNYWHDYIGIDGDGDGLGESMPYTHNISSGGDFLPLTNNEPIYNLNTSEYFYSIQDAIDDSDTLNGHIIEVGNNTYYENINVHKELTIRSKYGPEKTTIRGTNPGESLFNVQNKNHVNISGFTLINTVWGAYNVIYFNNADNCVLMNNIIVGRQFTVDCYYSDNLLMMNNTITTALDLSGGFTLFGVTLVSSNNIQFIDNSVSNVTYGIRLGSSDNIQIINNNMYGNYYGIQMMLYISNILIAENNIDNNLIIGVNSSYSSNLEISNNTITNSSGGINLWGVEDANIHNNTIKQNSVGIQLNSALNNNIFCNNISMNSYSALTLFDSQHNIIRDNIISNNEYVLVAFIGHSNTIYNNIITENENIVHTGWDDSYINNNWNITKTLGKNIINGPYLGGNYWGNYTGVDIDNDGLGDTNTPHWPGDYHPLVSFTYPIINLDTGEGFLTIQSAIDDSDTLYGHTIEVNDGIYYENIYVNKGLNIISKNGPTNCIINASDPNYHALQISTNNVNISGFTIENVTGSLRAGIFLRDASYCHISQNNILNNFYGIYLEWFTFGSSNNDIASNTINNNYYGIYLDQYCNGNDIIGNTARNNTYAIYLEYSHYNFITNNTVSNNSGGIRLGMSDYNNIIGNNLSDNTGAAIELNSDSDNNIVTGNDASNNSIGIKIHTSENNNIIGNTANSNTRAGIYIYNADNNIITENTANSNNYPGIELSNSNDNDITGNNVSFNTQYGIMVYSSDNNNITGNTANLSGWYGIYIYGGSNNNSIIGNDVNLNGYAGINISYSDHNDINNNAITNNKNGTVLWYVQHNNIIGNTVSDNNLYGIQLKWSSNNTIAGNTILNNIDDGINLEASSSNTLTDNNISYNSDGIRLSSSSNNNQFTGNNVFTNNDDGIDLSESSSNVFTDNKVYANNDVGIRLSFSDSNTFSGNNVTLNNYYGINLSSSISNTFTANNVHSNNNDGINLDSSSSNTFTDNDVSANSDGIRLSSSSNNNQFTDNYVFTNNDEGIDLSESNNNTFTGNYVYSNNDIGIRLSISGYNMFTGNNVTLNNHFGINMSSSNSNTIYDNYFDNTNNAYDDGNNIWNTTKTLGTNIIGGAYIGGNYWSDYTGADTDGDGLGDTNTPHGPGDYLPLTDVNLGPVADFSWTPTNPTTQDMIQFTDASTDPGKSLVSWYWDFADGNTSTQQHPTHQYNMQGNYSVCLTISDNVGATDMICKNVIVYNPVEVIDVNQSVFDRGFPIRHATDGDWAAAQSYTPTVIEITSCEIYLRKFGTPEFDLTVELRMNHPQGTLLDTLVFTQEEIASSWQWLILDFSDAPVIPDTEYFIVIPPAPSGVTTSFGYEWGYAFGNQYDGGAFWFTRDGGSLWRDLPTSYEFVFKTYGYE